MKDTAWIYGKGPDLWCAHRADSKPGSSLVSLAIQTLMVHYEDSTQTPHLPSITFFLYECTWLRSHTEWLGFYDRNLNRQNSVHDIHSSHKFLWCCHRVHESEPFVGHA